MPLSVRDRGNGLPHRSPTAIQDDSTRLILQVFQHKSCASWNILWSVGYFRFIQCAKPARCIDGNYKITPGCETLSQVSVTLVTWPIMNLRPLFTPLLALSSSHFPSVAYWLLVPGRSGTVL